MSTTSKEEEKWFQERNAQLRRELRQDMDKSAREARERRKMSQTLGTADEELVERLRSLNFDSDTARALDVLPLIYVAWSDGKIQHRERATILKILADRGVKEDDQAFILVEALLEERPSDEFLDEVLEVLSLIAKERPEIVNNLAEFSVAIASASGGIFGFGSKISAEERDIINSIAEGLGGDANAAFKDALSKK